MDRIPVVNWKHWRSWAWLLVSFTLIELFDLTQTWLLVVEGNPNAGFSPAFIRRELLETYWLALLVPAFWHLASRLHYQRCLWWWWLTGNVSLIALFVGLHIAGFQLLYAASNALGGQPWRWSGIVLPWHPIAALSSAFQLVLILAAFYGLDAHRSFRSRETLAVKLTAQLAEARLQALQMQLQPHFLFNTLQAITGLVHAYPHQAEEMLVRLGELLRIVLDHDEAAFVSLEQELKLVKKYVQIQQVRFGQRLQLQWKIDPDSLRIPVPTLILQPLVENAIVHGATSGSGRLTIGARLYADHLKLWVADQGPGPQNNLSLGHGLGNIRKRLESLYGSSDQLKLGAQRSGGTMVSIDLPLHDGPSLLAT